MSTHSQANLCLRQIQAFLCTQGCHFCLYFLFFLPYIFHRFSCIFLYCFHFQLIWQNQVSLSHRMVSVIHSVFKVEGLLRFSSKLACRYLRQLLGKFYAFPNRMRPGLRNGHFWTLYAKYAQSYNFYSILMKFIWQLKKIMMHKNKFAFFDRTTREGAPVAK